MSKSSGEADPDMRFNSDGSVNIEETYDGSRRFTKKEYIYLWNLFQDMDPELFMDCRRIMGSDPVDMFLEINAYEYYASKANLK